MHIEKVTFFNNKYQKIAGKIYKNPDTSDGVIFCHGMFSTKDGYKITHLAEGIVNAGFTLLCFDFSFTGESEGNISELSVLQEVNDLRSAFDYFTEYGIENIHLIGSSMGGLVSLLFSSTENEIRSQTLIATPIMLPEVFAKNIDITSLPEDGATSVNGKIINNKFFKELREIEIESVISNINIPTLIIHGYMDNVVPVINAVSLIKKLSNKKRIALIQNGDHNLNRDSDIAILSENILEWLKENRV
jgi:pimeloyl-ACP methyl ester carboxylesterase